MKQGPIDRQLQAEKLAFKIVQQLLDPHNHFHGLTFAPEWRVYCDVRNRCENANNKNFHNYGGRGIKFLFTSFVEFIRHVGFRPTPEHSLDRINNDGNYELGNIRWATKSQQNANRRVSQRRTSIAKTLEVANVGA